mmetsp:Transcript_51501/g.122636  ORF Transcript_51501/g.122636 Transcript_51501/m.122636 type:complete len:250 (-) Transcript_51501:39-788(-)
MDSMELAVCAGSTVFFQAVFQVVANGKDPEKFKLKSIYVSHLHCMIAISSCLLYWCTQSVSVMAPEFMVEGPTDPALANWMRRTISFSVGYFINDLAMMLIHTDMYESDMVAHHIIIGGFFFLGLLDRCCTSYHFLFLIEELSTPFLNLRWQYRTQKDSPVYKFSQTAFAVLFFLSRIMIGTGIVWVSGCKMLPGYIMAQPSRLRQVHLTMQFVACTLSRGLNLFWFSKIVKIVMRGGTKVYIDENKME